MPPSRHSKGSVYRWLPGLSPEEVEPMAFPAALAELLDSRSNGQALVMQAEELSLSEHTGAAKGERYDTLCRLVGRYLNQRGLDADLLPTALAWAERCQPPYSADEVNKVVAGLVAKENAKRPKAVVIQPAPTTLRGVPMSQLGEGKPPRWLWDGLIAEANATLLVSVWKCGKSTLLSHLLQQMAAGSDQLGFPVSQGGAYLLSEEQQGHWRKRRDELGIGDHVTADCRPFKGRPTRNEWQGYCQELAKAVARGDFKLVIIDTWSQLTPEHNENDASEVTNVLMPLQLILDEGGSVLISHHSSKSDANEGKASRGSGALPAAVDIIVEMRRSNPSDPQSTVRSFKGYGRFDETPAAFDLQLTDSGYQAVTVMQGPRATKRDEVGDWLEAQLADGAVAADEIWKRAEEKDFKERTVKRAKEAREIESVRQGDQWFWQLPGLSENHRF